MLIGFIFLNMAFCAGAMERANLFAHLLLMQAVAPELFDQASQSELNCFHDQPDKKIFSKIVHNTKPKKGYASEKRLLAPRNKIRGK